MRLSTRSQLHYFYLSTRSTSSRRLDTFTRRSTTARQNRNSKQSAIVTPTETSVSYNHIYLYFFVVGMACGRPIT